MSDNDSMPELETGSDDSSPDDMYSSDEFNHWRMHMVRSFTPYPFRHEDYIPLGGWRRTHLTTLAGPVPDIPDDNSDEDADLPDLVYLSYEDSYDSDDSFDDNFDDTSTTAA
jgi:hypothetical protein